MMKADHQKKSNMPKWAVVVLSGMVAAAIVGSGVGNVSASTPDRASRGDSQASGNNPAVGTQYFQDVPSTSPFFSYVNAVYLEGLVGGYPCGGPNEPCVPPGNLPYYRPGANLTRGQMAKITNLGQNMTVHDLPVPFKIINTTPASVAMWGGNSGIGPARDPLNINAGLYGDATGTNNSIGMLTESDHDNGAWILSNSAAAYSVYVPHNGADIEQGGSGPADALHVAGHVTITGGCTGCALDAVMMNTGTADLHPGDVVALGALAPQGTMVDGNAVGGVSASSQAYNTAVVGVVGMRYVPGDPSAPVGTAEHTGGRDNTATVIKPGEYMTVVTEGTYNLVKVDGGKDGIHAGDLLTTGATAGTAMKATDKLASIGAILGKAMGNLDSGIGYIPVLITLK
jgi:hypothetical protein